MSSQVQIYNMALSAAGVRNSVSDPSETSREAQVCTLWYEHVRDLVFRAADWHSLRSVRRLGLLSERDFSATWTVGDPEPPWRFAYSPPSDMIHPRFLQTYNRFAQGLQNDTKLAIFTDDEDALLLYNKKQTDVTKWDTALTNAVVFGLASMVAQPLTGKGNIVDKLMQKANAVIYESRVLVANEDEDFYETSPDWITARGYAESGSRIRFIFPYGPALSNTAGVLGPGVLYAE